MGKQRFYFPGRLARGAAMPYNGSSAAGRGKTHGEGTHMRTYGIGIIGWGFMGQTHALAIRTLPLFYADADFRAEIRCICTRREAVARQAAADMGADWTCDYRELLRRDDIDVVSVCTPNAQHEQMALDALAAKKHLYIDKPLAVTGEEARRVAAAALSLIHI